MEQKESKLSVVLKRIFKVMTVLILLYLLFGESFFPDGYGENNITAEPFAIAWERILPDGERQQVTLPADFGNPGDQPIVLSATLPKDLSDNLWIGYTANRQSVTVTIDGRMVASYQPEDKRFFGTLSANYVVMIPLCSDDSGKEIRMTLTGNSSLSGYVAEMSIGDRFALWGHYIWVHGRNLPVACVLLIFGLSCIIFSAVLFFTFKRSIALGYLGWGMILVAIWITFENKIRQLYMPNVSISSDVSYFAAMLMTFPFMCYVDQIQNRRYHKVYTTMETIVMTNFVCCTTLHITGLVELSNMLREIQVLIGCSFALFVITFILDVCRGYIKEYLWVGIGFFILFLAAVDEIVRIIGHTSGNGGLVVGTAVIFIMAIVKTGQDLLQIEGEKQKAILERDAKVKFLANMSHEIRTPINAIIGMNEMVLRENKDPNLEGYISDIESAGKMLLSLVNDILDLSKIEADKMTLVSQPYELSSMLNDVIQGIRPRMEKKHLEFLVRIDESLPSMYLGDEVRIKQVINNLLTNAVKYTDRGSVTLEVGGYLLDEKHMMLCVTVSDTGQGIKKENLAVLFDSFTRLEQEKNASIEGTGLGLHITQLIVRQMNGTIAVESEYGKGSVFTVKYPQVIEKETPVGNIAMHHGEHRTVRQEQFHAPDAVVLIVDDNEMNLHVATSLLKWTRIRTETAQSGAIALEMCRKKKYDVIFMDHMMPQMDGVEALQQLRSDPEGKNQTTTVIVLTANAISGMKEWYFSQGFDDYLSKPIDIRCLERMLVKYLPKEKILPVETLREQENPHPAKDRQPDIRSEEETEASQQAAAGQVMPSADTQKYARLLLGHKEQTQLERQYLQQFAECENAENFAKMIRSEEWKQFRLYLHRMKCIAFGLADDALLTAARAAEEASRNVSGQTTENLSGVLEAFEKLTACCRQWEEEANGL